jgi:hypothetical protein
VLYDNLDVSYWNFDIDTTKDDKGNYTKLSNTKLITRWDIVNREQDLKLFIKIPTSCKSSIVVLEGDFRNFNNFKFTPAIVNSNQTVWEYKRNHDIINFANPDILNDLDFNLIHRLQLLAFNTGESYPFADRLIEYLSGSVITSIDEVSDNIKRAQKIMKQNNYYFKIDGIWEDKMQKIVYDYMMNTGPIEVVNNKLTDKRVGYHPRLGHTSKSMLYDNLGYIDKEAEKWYSSWKIEKDKNKIRNDEAKIRDNIQNVDIYNGLFDI